MSMLPLHSNAKGAGLGDCGNAGLWFEKFFSAYPNASEETLNKSKRRDDKYDWLSQFTDHPHGDFTVLADANGRIKDLVEARGGQAKLFSVSWRFATGLGSPHPTGNGFLWHPTLGVPYFPASGIKGLLRAWLENWAEPAPSKHLDEWLGTPARMGNLVFFDALPVNPVSVVVAVVAPGQGKWYEQGGRDQADAGSAAWERLPADWHQPTLTQFLAVQGATFQVCIAPSRRTGGGEVGSALAELGSAFEWLGVGAKTAAGYGKLSSSVDVLRP